MKLLSALRAPPAIAGRVEAIVVRGDPRLPARLIERTIARAGIGLADDRLAAVAGPPQDSGVPHGGRRAKASGGGAISQRGEAELSTRQVTLIQHEHLPMIAQLARVTSVDPVALQRNLIVSGINLLALKNARLRVGEALLELVGPCHPCSRMEEAIGRGGYAAMRGHGGMTARVLEDGPIAVGDAVSALAAETAGSAGVGRSR